MNNNSSKQILLSVIGVAILVVAVVGVSFAFFTYTKKGTQNNTITTGTLSFAFEESSKITLTDHFPIDTVTELPASDSKCEFTVTGKAPLGTTLNYRVFAMPGDDTSFTGKTKFTDDEISIYLESSDATITNNANLEEGTPVASLTSQTNGTLSGKLLAEGSIVGEGSAKSKTVNFTAKMWVDSDVVKIINGDGAVTNSSKHEYTADDYANKYYTMKIAVFAQDGTF